MLQLLEVLAVIALLGRTQVEVEFHSVPLASQAFIHLFMQAHALLAQVDRTALPQWMVLAILAIRVPTHHKTQHLPALLAG